MLLSHCVLEGGLKSWKGHPEAPSSPNSFPFTLLLFCRLLLTQVQHHFLQCIMLSAALQERGFLKLYLSSLLPLAFTVPCTLAALGPYTACGRCCSAYSIFLPCLMLSSQSCSSPIRSTESTGQMGGKRGLAFDSQCYCSISFNIHNLGGFSLDFF